MKRTYQTNSAPPGQITVPGKIQRRRMVFGVMLAAMFYTLLGPGTNAMAADVVLAQARADFSPVTFTAHDALGNAPSLPQVLVETNGGTVTTDGNLVTLGPVTLNNGALTATSGNSWNLVDIALTKSFGANFAVAGFSPQPDGLTWITAAGMWRRDFRHANLTCAAQPIA